MSFRRPLHRPVAAVLLALALAGCGTVAPSATPAAVPTGAAPASPEPTDAGGSPRPPAEVYAEIRTAVEQIRGLRPTASVDPVTIDEAQLRANLEAEFDSTYTPATLRDAEDLLIVLGLLPKGASLRALTLDFQGSQVAGYYSPEKDQLFVVNRSGSLGPVDEATYAHEFTHQLQDQHVDLDALGIAVADQSDRSLARLALVEGDASSVQSIWIGQNLDAKELGELLAASLDPEALAALQRAPAYLRDTALFPYQDGLAFVTRLTSNGGFAAVDAAFADPPDSTEQILHPDKYLVRERPIEVELPQLVLDGVGGSKNVAEDTLGELILRIWLTEGGVPATQARTAAAGWGGDRLALFRAPDGAVSLYLKSEWDSAADADEFATAAATALAKLAPAGRLAHQPGTTTVTIAIGAAVTALAAIAGG